MRVPVIVRGIVSVVVKSTVIVTFWVLCRTWYSCTKYGCPMAHGMPVSLNLTETNGP